MKLFIKRIVVLLLVVAQLLPVCEIPAAHAADKIDSKIRFNDFYGEVKIRPDSEEDDSYEFVDLDTVIYEGDRIKTEEDSGAILGLEDMSTYVIKPDSTLIIHTDEGNVSKIEMLAGSMWGNIKKMSEGKSLEIEMSQCVCGINGTTIYAQTSVPVQKKLDLNEIKKDEDQIKKQVDEIQKNIDKAKNGEREQQVIVIGDRKKLTNGNNPQTDETKQTVADNFRKEFEEAKILREGDDLLIYLDSDRLKNKFIEPQMPTLDNPQLKTNDKNQEEIVQGLVGVLHKMPQESTLDNPQLKTLDQIQSERPQLQTFDQVNTEPKQQTEMEKVLASLPKAKSVKFQVPSNYLNGFNKNNNNENHSEELKKQVENLKQSLGKPQEMFAVRYESNRNDSYKAAFQQTQQNKSPVDALASTGNNSEAVLSNPQNTGLVVKKDKIDPEFGNNNENKSQTAGIQVQLVKPNEKNTNIETDNNNNNNNNNDSRVINKNNNTLNNKYRVHSPGSEKDKQESLEIIKKKEEEQKRQEEEKRNKLLDDLRQKVEKLKQEEELKKQEEEKKKQEEKQRKQLKSDNQERLNEQVENEQLKKQQQVLKEKQQQSLKERLQEAQQNKSPVDALASTENNSQSLLTGKNVAFRVKKEPEHKKIKVNPSKINVVVNSDDNDQQNNNNNENDENNIIENDNNGNNNNNNNNNNNENDGDPFVVSVTKMNDNSSNNNNNANNKELENIIKRINDRKLNNGLDDGFNKSPKIWGGANKISEEEIKEWKERKQKEQLEKKEEELKKEEKELKQQDRKLDKEEEEINKQEEALKKEEEEINKRNEDYLKQLIEAENIVRKNGNRKELKEIQKLNDIKRTKMQQQTKQEMEVLRKKQGQVQQERQALQAKQQDAQQKRQALQEKQANLNNQRAQLNNKNQQIGIVANVKNEPQIKDVIAPVNNNHQPNIADRVDSIAAKLNNEAQQKNNPAKTTAPGVPNTLV